jgi:NAD(P) transhydrogenase
MSYDLIVIGSGPAGQKAAIAGAKLGKRVAIVERQQRVIGGVCLHTGTIPSKTMREAILHLTGFLQRDVYGDLYHKKHSITMPDLMRKLAQVTKNEVDVINDHFDSNNIEVIEGEASFRSPHEISVQQGEVAMIIEGEKIVLACGTRPARPSHIPFDDRRVFDSDDILKLQKIPRNMIVVGGGVVGFEYAIMFAVLGVNVTVIEGRDHLLGFCDREISESLLYQARSLGMMFRFGETVTGIHEVNEKRVAVELESGKRLAADTVLFSVGRVGDSQNLNPELAGIECDDRGRIKCSEDLQTSAQHIYAVGDIVGFPALASTSMEQGRRAVYHAFDQPFKSWDHLPYGLYTIPEIAMIGKTEQELTQESVPYEVGKAQFSEIARGQINGDLTGMLKLIFHRDTKELLGVHCIGDNATELIHIGQAVMAHNGTVEYFRDAVFNYPTYAECYKVAAFDGLNRAMLSEIETESLVAV